MKKIDFMEVYAWVMIILGIVVLVGGAVEIY